MKESSTGTPLRMGAGTSLRRLNKRRDLSLTPCSPLNATSHRHPWYIPLVSSISTWAICNSLYFPEVLVVGLSMTLTGYTEKVESKLSRKVIVHRALQSCP